MLVRALKMIEQAKQAHFIVTNVEPLKRDTFMDLVNIDKILLEG